MDLRADRIFISAVTDELGSYRKVVSDRLEKLDQEPVTKESLPPDHRELTESLAQAIKSCDIVFYLLGRAFGKRTNTPESMQSYTQLEYSLARELGKDTYVFVPSPDCATDQLLECESPDMISAQAGHVESVKKEHKWEVFSDQISLEKLVDEIVVSRLRNRKIMEPERPGVRIDFSGRAADLPGYLHPREPYIDRLGKVTILERSLKRQHAILITGLPDVGKKQLVAHCLSSPTLIQSIRADFNAPITLLAVNFPSSSGSRPVLRRLAFALGEDRDLSLTGLAGYSREELDDVRDRLINDLLERATRRDDHKVLTILSGVHRVSEASSLEDLEQLLQSPALDDGCTVLVSCRAIYPKIGKRFSKFAEVEVAPFEKEDAIELLDTLLVDHEIACKAVSSIQGSVPLFPGVLKNAVEAFHQTGGGDADQLALYILDAQERTHSARELLGPYNLASLLENGTPTALAGLLALAIIPLVEVRPQLFEAAQLSIPPLSQLQEYHWIERSEEGTAGSLAPLAVAVLRSEIVRMHRSEPENLPLIAQVLEKMVRAAMMDISDSQQAYIKAHMEEGLSWIQETAPDMSIVRVLREQLLLHSVADIVPPFSKVESHEILEQSISGDSTRILEQQLAKLVQLSRYEEDCEEFIALIKQIPAAVHAASRFGGTELAIMDQCLFLGCRRFHVYEEVSKVRINIIDMLELSFDAWCERDFRAAKYTVSWILNAAADAVLARSYDESRQLLDKALPLVEHLSKTAGAYSPCDVLWLRIRASQIEARLENSFESVLNALRRGQEFAQEGFSVSHGQLWWLSYFFKATRRLTEVLPDDNLRLKLISDLTAVLRKQFGPEDSWAVGICAQFSSLCLNISFGIYNIEEQISQVRHSHELMDKLKDSSWHYARLGDIRALMVWVHTKERLAICLARMDNFVEGNRILDEAIQIAEHSGTYRKDSGYWRTLIRLYLLKSNFGVEDDPEINPEGVTEFRLSTVVREVLNRTHDWVKAKKVKSEEDGRLELLRWRLIWRSRGDLVSYVINLQRNGENVRPWPDLPERVKVKTLDEEFQRRRNVVQAIRRTCGDSQELWVVQAWLTAQWQRLRKIHGRGQVEYDADAPLRVFDEGLSTLRFLDSYELREQRAKYLRYIWRNAEAIRSFREILRDTPNGVQRFRVQLSLLECLATSVINYDDLDMNDDSEFSRTNLIEYAIHEIGQLEQANARSVRVILLRGQIWLEAGRPIEWARIDEKYNLAIGPELIEQLPKMLEVIEEKRREIGDEPRDIGDLLLQDPTRIETLASLGKLYLRAAELESLEWDQEKRIEAARRAYLSYEGARIFEQAFLGHETAVTRFARARCIIVAHAIAGTPNPIPGIRAGRWTYQVRAAMALLQSARDFSVGAFHDRVIAEQVRVNSLPSIRQFLRSNA